MTSSPAIQKATAIASAARATGLGKIIDDRAIVQNISFNIGRGEFVALLGANGAGKSTLLKMLATLIAPSHGELFLFGERCRTDCTRLRAQIGLIGHGPMLYRELTAMENLVFFGRLYGVATPLKRAAELLDWIGLSHRGDDAVKTFSRGMVQRVAIARALMHSPELLLADEPFAGLDAPSSDMLQRMLISLNEQGRTIIFANHDIQQSLALASRALVLRKGQLTIDSPSADLDSRAVLREVSES